MKRLHAGGSLPGSGRGSPAGASRARAASSGLPPERHWHALPGDTVLELLGVDPAAGLSRSEVAERRARHGLNRITPRAGPPAWKRALRQFHQPLVYLLLVAVAVTALLGEWVDSSVICPA